MSTGWLPPDPSMLLFLPAERQWLCYMARHSGAAALILQALVRRAARHYRQNAQCAAIIGLEYQAFLLAPPPLIVAWP